MSDWPQRIAELVELHGIVARAVILQATAPTPRAVGSAVMVAGTAVEGRIGRGDLERAVIEAAAELLAEYRSDAAGPAWLRRIKTFGSGMVMGQPTGGLISVLIEVYGPAEILALDAMGWKGGVRGGFLARPLDSGHRPHVIASLSEGQRLTPGLETAASELSADCMQRLSVGGSVLEPQRWVVERLGRAAVPFYVYGTGLIARAVVKALVDLPFEVRWIDTNPAHFPSDVNGRAERLTANEPERVAAIAPPGAFHAVMTQAHELDYRICRELLRSGTFGYLGVIGAPLKRTRMEQRLAAEGIVTEALTRMSCPIGLAEISSKEPAVIAVSVAAEALIALQRENDNAQQKGSKR